jgi:hypothetical protein
MRQAAWILVGWIGLAAVTWAGPTVQIEDVTSGKNSGPVEVRDGAQFVIEGRTFRIKTERVAGLSIEEKLKRIKIDEIDMQDTSLAGAVEFLKRAGKEGDTFSPEDQRGINIGLSVSEEQKARLIHFQARNVTLLEALRTMTKLAGVRYELTRDVVMIVPAREGQAEEMTTRSYTINQAMLPGIRQTTPKAYFENMGVAFPQGATISYNAGMGRVMIFNTAQNLKTMDRVVAGLGGRSVGE